MWVPPAVTGAVGVVLFLRLGQVVTEIGLSGDGQTRSCVGQEPFLPGLLTKWSNPHE
jgi:hypothetical protein